MSKDNQNQNHLDYWSKRSDDIFRYLDRKDIDFFAELNEIYSEQAAEMQKAFFDFVSKYSDDGSMSYQEALQRLKGTDLSDYQANARKYREQAEKDPELLKRLNEQYASARATRLESLQMDLLFRMGVARGVVEGKFGKYLEKMAIMGYTKAMGGRPGTINKPALEELTRTPFNGYNYSQQLWGNTDNLVKDLKKVLKQGFVRGDHYRTMARDLASKYNVARSRAETLVRTDGTMIVNRAAVQRYKDAGLKYYRILVHLDNRTTQICRRIHAENKRYLIDEMEPGVTAPPFHFNCRSGVIPDEDELEGGDLAKSDVKMYNHGIDDSGTVFQSGSISAARGDVEKQKDEFADRYYEQLRNSDRTSVISKMVASSGLSKEVVSNALEHVLDNQYLLWDFDAAEERKMNFYPHYDMAQSFQRLYLGNPRERDKIMLQHESLESHYMNTLKMDYDDAHKLANMRYNYQGADKDEKN